MSGNMWIAIGIVSSAIGLFSIPYGFHKKGKEETTIESTQSKLEGSIIPKESNEKQKIPLPGKELNEESIVLHFNNSGLNFILKKNLEKAIEAFRSAKNRSSNPQTINEIIIFLEDKSSDFKDSVYQNTESSWLEIYKFFLNEHPEILDSNYLSRFNRAIDTN